MTEVIKIPENGVAPETGLPLTRSILHESDVQPVPQTVDTSAQDAYDAAAQDVQEREVALIKEAAITGDTHIELGGVVVPLVPEDMITTESKVHATPAPTTRNTD